MTDEQIKDEMTAIYKQIDEDIELNDDQRMKVIMTFAGMLDGMHTKLDYVRDLPSEHDARNPIDHHVEQAQIAIENAMMRLEQVSRVVIARMDAEADEDTDTDTEEQD